MRTLADTLRDTVDLCEEKERKKKLLTKAESITDSLQQEICDYIAQYSGPECLDICQRMQQHLPRELRDLVYNYVLDTSSKCVIVPMYRRAWEAETKTEIGGVLCNPWKPYFQYRNILHTLDESFVDLATRKELVEAFYYC
jgi:hypothetical protein